MEWAVVLSTLGLLFSLWVTYWLHSQYHLDIEVKATPPLQPAPLISVIVPARNEARNIRACLLGLLRQSYPNVEVIVVDDRSTDETPHILAELARSDPRLMVVSGSPLPPGWAGKPHALHQGAQRASGGWLCFVDADTFARPALLASTLAAARQTGAGLFTILTDQRLGSFWEKVIQPLVFTALSVGFSPRRVNDPARPDAVANGQFLLFPRPVYEAIGGHRAVAGSVVEDRDLARLVKQSGYRLVVADGRAVAETRMYTSLDEIWEGWTKNIYLGLSDHPGLALLGLFGALLSLLGALALPGWLVAGAAWAASGGGCPAWLVLSEAAAAWAVLMAVRVQVSRSFGIHPLYALTLPLGALVFAAMMAASTFQVLSGRGVRWKGRRYAARKNQPAGGTGKTGE